MVESLKVMKNGAFNVKFYDDPKTVYITKEVFEKSVFVKFG